MAASAGSLTDQVPSDLLRRMALPALSQPFVGAVDPTLAKSDAMVDMTRPEPFEHYFSVGASALNCILASAALAKVSLGTILDFGCGAGRVTRWLCAAFPGAKISACDLREDDLRFVRERFDVNTWLSGTDPAYLDTPQECFDLIWVGSVITHLDETTSITLLQKIFSWLTPKGLLIASLHGRPARFFGDVNTPTYLPIEDWSHVRAAYDDKGHGYFDYAGQSNYGISVASPHWTIGLLDHIAGARVVLFGEALWDNHHDLIALQRWDGKRRSFRQPGAERAQ